MAVDINHEIAVNVGWGTIAGAYAVALALAASPMPGGRLAGALLTLIIISINIIY